MRKLLIGLVIVAFVLSLTIGVFAEKQYVIGFSNASVSNTWRVAMYNFAMAEGKKLGVQMLYTDANDNSAKQISDVEDLMSKGINALVISPATEDALSAVVAKAYDSGIPVIVFDRRVNTPKYTTFVVTDDVRNGNGAGQWVVKLLKQKYGAAKGKVVEIQGWMGSGPQIDRHKGIMDVLSKYKGIQIVSSQAADFQRAKGKTVMENILQAQPQIDVVVSQSGESLCGAVEAIKAAGRMKEIKLVAIDGYNGVLKGIKSGEIVSTQLFPASLGAEAVRVALKALKGEKIPKQWDFPGAEVTQKNVDKYLDPNGPDSEWTF